MNGYYTCNNKLFDNYYQGLDYSTKNGSFLNYSVSNDAIVAYTSVVLNFEKPTTTLAEEKLVKLRNKNKKLHLHYSGGTDSHTILKIADKLGIEFDLITTETNSITGNEYVDRDYTYAMNYCQGRKNYKTIVPTLEDYAMYDDPEWYMYRPGAVFTFRPNFAANWMSKHNLSGYVGITGLSKPNFYIDNDNNYYWVITDTQINEYVGYDTCHFYIDEHHPEYAVSQVYAAKQFLENHKVSGWVNTENICSYGFTLDEKKKFNAALGRILPDDPVIINASLGKNNASYLNPKSLRAMTELCEKGHNGVVAKFFHSVEHKKTRFKDTLYGLEIINQEASRELRIGAVFAVTGSGLKFVDHSEHPWNMPK